MDQQYLKIYFIEILDYYLRQIFWFIAMKVIKDIDINKKWISKTIESVRGSALQFPPWNATKWGNCKLEPHSLITTAVKFKNFIRFIDELRLNPDTGTEV